MSQLVTIIKANSVVCWTGRLVRNRITTVLIFTAVFLCGFAFRLLGMRRSLWLDEAWVANSIIAKSLTGMFYYDSWLQTSPPLFLLLVRITVRSLGLTNSVLRLIPLLFGLLSAVLMFILVRRVLSKRFALLAWAMFFLSPLAILFSKTLKQFSLELALTSALLLICILYLESPTRERFRLLLATVAIGPFLAYTVGFIVPGIILVVCSAGSQSGPALLGLTPQRRNGLVRGLILALVSGALLVAVFIVCVSPNSSSSLRSYWVQDRGDRNPALRALSDAHSLFYQLPIPRPVLDSAPVNTAIGALFLMGFPLALLRFRQGRRRWLEVQVICAVPCVLIIVASGLSLYPINERMSLFLLPAVILLLMCNLQLLVHFVIVRVRRSVLVPLLDAVLVCVTLLIVCVSIVKHPIAAQNVPLEDMASAISFLRLNVQGGDHLWVHASSGETFKLYKYMTGWNDAVVQYGQTGWPCCPRGVVAVKGSGKEADVRSDINSAIPNNISGRVWLLYTTRPEHWAFVGIDESRILNSVFRERGCLLRPVPFFQGIGISVFDCPPRFAEVKRSAE